MTATASASVSSISFISIWVKPKTAPPGAPACGRGAAGAGGRGTRKRCSRSRRSGRHGAGRSNRFRLARLALEDEAAAAIGARRLAPGAEVQEDPGVAELAAASGDHHFRDV